MESNKDVVFVAAAGNEGKWVDDKVNLQIPCGISAENLVCVGALNSKGNLAAFSNIVLSDGVFVATAGVDIKSLAPSEMCDSANIGNLDGDYFSAGDLSSLLSLLQKDCSSPQGLRTASGTSMASPIVARSVAQLMMRYPKANAVEIIKILVDSSQKKQLGPMTLNIIPFEKPTWY
jgi:subtilisin family serine protease